MPKSARKPFGKVNQTLHPIRIPIKTMSMISIELMKLKEYKGCKYVIAAVDYFTKYIKMGCLKQKCTKEVTKWLFDNIFCQYRVCDVHITDNGTEFVDHIAKDLYDRTSCSHCITMPYHPNTNGLVS